MKTPTYVPELARSYDASASRYRSDDEIEVNSASHARLAAILRNTCRSFTKPIRVLEIGCGTGRNFHCLENVESLVGTDISAEMLRFASQPVRGMQVSEKQLTLIQGDLAVMDFPDASFDFIYSLGVFGYGASWTKELSSKASAWLSPGGRVFFNAIEVPHFHNSMHRLKYTVKSVVYPRLPDSVRKVLESSDTVPIVRHSPSAVRSIMESTGFTDIAISSQRCDSPLWKGVHLECQAKKAGSAPSPRARA